MHGGVWTSNHGSAWGAHEMCESRGACGSECGAMTECTSEHVCPPDGSQMLVSWAILQLCKYVA